MKKSEHGDFKKFPIGTLVRVNTNFQDFNFFNKTETGIVIRNSNSYLGIIVAFDEPRHFEGGVIQYTWNFNPDNLVILKKANKLLVADAIKKRKDVEPDGCEHASDIKYCELCKPTVETCKSCKQEFRVSYKIVR